MEMNAAILIFFLLLLVYTLMSEVFTVLFRIAGMTKEKARFQVISMLTNSGFTTNESEMIVKDPLRRKLAVLTMLFGYAFTATIVSISINVLLRLNEAGNGNMLRLTAPLLFWGCCFLLLIRTKWIKHKFDNLIESLGNRMIHSGKNKNSVILLDYIGEFVLAEAEIKRLPEALKNRTVAQSRLNETYAITVLMVKRRGTVISDVGGICLQERDRLVLFGPPADIKKLFSCESL